MISHQYRFSKTKEYSLNQDFKLFAKDLGLSHTKKPLSWDWFILTNSSLISTSIVRFTYRHYSTGVECFQYQTHAYKSIHIRMQLYASECTVNIHRTDSHIMHTATYIAQTATYIQRIYSHGTNIAHTVTYIAHFATYISNTAACITQTATNNDYTATYGV